LGEKFYSPKFLAQYFWPKIGGIKNGVIDECDEYIYDNSLFGETIVTKYNLGPKLEKQKVSFSKNKNFR